MKIGYNDVWTFDFKSYVQYYWREKKDIKNNTVRKIDIHDRRFIKLLLLADEGWNDGEARIRITCAENPEECFVREIRDICVFGGLVVITWHPKQTTKQIDGFTDPASITRAKRIHAIGTGKTEGQRRVN